MHYLSRKTRNEILINILESGVSLSQAQQGLMVGLSQQMISKILQNKANNVPLCRKQPGRTPRMSSEQEANLGALLSKGSEFYGFEGNYWTYARVQQVIEKEFSLVFEVKQVGRILKKIGWTRQKPQKKTSNKTQPK
jgi:transposase